MDTNDRKAIETLFQKLGTVEQQVPQRDPEAERFIQDEITRHPGAPYYMAQTIVVQEQALEAAQRRIQELENQPQAQPQGGSGGGLFGGLFGGGDRTEARRPAGAVPRVGSVPATGASKWGSGAGVNTGADQRGFAAGRGGGGMGGGGFLAGAAQTAMGVAGGVLLGNAIAGMFGGNEAQAADATPEPAAQPAAEPDNAQVEDAGYDDAGGFDDGGGFDDI